MGKEQAAYLMGPLNFCPICGQAWEQADKRTIGDFVDWARKHSPLMTTELGSTKQFVGKKAITTWKKMHGQKPMLTKRKIRLFKTVPEEHNLCGFCHAQLSENMVDFLNPVKISEEINVDVVTPEPDLK